MNTSESAIFEKLYTRLYELLHNLNRYVPNIGCDEILKMYEKLDITLMMVRYLKIMSIHNEILKSQNKVNEQVEAIFVSPLIILPGINVSELWQQLTNPQKEKIWLSLRLVYMTGFQAIEMSHTARHKKDKQNGNIINVNNGSRKNEDEEEEEEKEKSKEKKEVIFDPFIGIGTNSDEYSVTDVYQGMESLEDIKYRDPGVGSLVSIFKLDKLVNIDKLTEQLKTMTKEDIEKATNSIQSLLSTNDNATQKFLKELLDKIKNQLENIDLTTGTSSEKIDKFASIIDVVASGMKPHVANGNVDVKGMFNNAHTLFKDIAANNDVPIEQQNQINEITNIFKVLQTKPQKMQDKKYMNDMFKKLGVDPNQVQKISKKFK